MRIFPLLLFIPLIAAAEEPVRFNRDIRPIMSDTCFLCHGFDAGTRKAGLRLDLREEAIKETEEGALPIVPGDPEKSEIIFRIFDEDDPMPPTKAHKPLSAEQKELFRRWVAEGAIYEPHWSYAPLTRPALPDGYEAEHPIDAFIRTKLAEAGLQPSPRASRSVLTRRLALDLTGLPPQSLALGESEATLSLDELTEHLLQSPHFGERLAVWWLDIARFADTVGFHGDQNQRIFPYRDYVIEAFNANKPFDRFTTEQLAGDLLPEPSTEQLVATGYNRLNMMTREGGAQPQEFLAKYGAERVRSVSAAWFGSTFGCAECHDHKFDPIKTQDFYELQAFFADIKQWGVYSTYGYTPEPELRGFNNEYPFPPEIAVESPWLKKRYQQTLTAFQTHLARQVEVLQQDSKAKAAQAEWESSLQSFLSEHRDGWEIVHPSTAEIVKDGKVLKGRSATVEDKVVSVDKSLGRGETLRFSTTLPSGIPFTALRVRIVPDALDPTGFHDGLGKTLNLSLEVAPKKGARYKPSLRSGEATARRPEYRGGAEVPGLSTNWLLPWEHDPAEALVATWPLSAPLTLQDGDRLIVRVGGDCPLPFRLELSPFTGIDHEEATHREPGKIFGKAVADRTQKEVELAAEVFLLSTNYDVEAREKTWEFSEKLRGLFQGRAWTLVTQAVEEPLTVRVLPRGDWQDESGPVVLPATPSFLPGRLESSEEKRLTRLDLAKWITSEDNPITARTVMNRLWALFFGTGLSAVVDDLGSQGELPSHPELLDWLAVEFRESGWDLKHMVRLLVTSETYRQQSIYREDARAIDPANRLLAFQNPRRLEAEFVRDNALAIAGLLQAKEVGGPSVKPYQPAEYYASLQFPNRDYVAELGPEQWRRGLYTHWQRTFLHPMMANFDAPSRDECAAARINSNTPQQALTLLNDPSFVEAARVFAERLLKDPKLNDESRLAQAFQVALFRSPKTAEVAPLLQFISQQRETYRAAPEDAEKLLSVGLSARAKLDPIEHAAWTQLSRVLLNTQESITRY